jgi:HD superfamily phosphodiesterase
MVKTIIETTGVNYINHCYRIIDTAETIAKMDNIFYDEEILFFSCLLHDINEWAVNDKAQVFGGKEEEEIKNNLVSGFYMSEAKANKVISITHNYMDSNADSEASLVRNADVLDKLGYVAIAQAFSLFPLDMRKAIEFLHKKKDEYYKYIDLPFAKTMAITRIIEMDSFIQRFINETKEKY